MTVSRLELDFCPGAWGDGVKDRLDTNIAAPPQAFRRSGRRLQINYLTILYMVTPSPLGQTICLTGRTNLVVDGTRTAPHASGRVAKKAPLHVNPSQTPAPNLAKTK